MTASERILIVKLADIGDAVLALPAIQALKRTRPGARIDVLTTEAGASVFRLSPVVDEVILLAKHRFDHVRGLISPGGLIELARLAARLRRPGYSTVVLLHHLTTSFGTRKFRALVNATGASVVAGLDNGRGDFLTHRAQDFGFGACPEWQYGLDVTATLGAEPDPVRPELVVPRKARSSAEKILRQNGVSRPYAVIHAEVGEFSPARAWRFERFVDVARDLVQQTGLNVAFAGVDPWAYPYDRLDDIPGVESLAGKTSFAELCAIIEGASVVVGCDSAVTHLAGAFERPVVALFGPTNIAAWKPYGATQHLLDGRELPNASSLAVRLPIPCSPCIYTGFRLGRRFGCRTRACMMEIPTQPVSQAALHVLRS